MTTTEHLKPYPRVKKNLITIDGVPTNGDRIVIALSLRESILHSAHQGVLGMGFRANQSLY